MEDLFFIMGKLTCVIHLLFPFIFLPLARKLMAKGIKGSFRQWGMALIIFLLLTKTSEIVFGGCPLTFAEKWFLQQGGITPYEGDCLSFYWSMIYGA